ncbi:MAG: hypothetical protein WCF22_15795 [Candidatus Sulfotelmatobacter sp.]
MATQKDLDFVSFVLQQTRDEKIQWESTADEEKFIVSLKGKYRVSVDRAYQNHEPYHYLTLLDDSDRELLRVYEAESPTVPQLYELAKRNSLNVDAAIDEIMSDDVETKSGTITDEDIPF